MSPEAVALKYARVEPPPNIKNLSNNPLFVNGAANVSKNLLCKSISIKQLYTIISIKCKCICQKVINQSCIQVPLLI
uniref:Uncharacterized protein n=1 Tax=Glycine max TaxID=3847 RepID=C6T6N5_SOYBN|nr:unknown [Glycine max]